MPAQAVVVIVAVFLGLISFQLMCIDTVPRPDPCVQMRLDSSGIVTSVQLRMTAEMWLTVNVLPLAYLLYGLLLGNAGLSFHGIELNPTPPSRKLPLCLISLNHYPRFPDQYL